MANVPNPWYNSRPRRNPGGPKSSSWWSSRAYKNLPEKGKSLIGRRVHFSGIADKKWLDRKKKAKGRGLLDFRTEEGRQKYKEFIQKATKEGACRNLCGLIVGFQSFGNADNIGFYVQLDPNIKKEDDVDIVMVTEKKLTNVIAPTEVDLIELMTHKIRAVREFAAIYFKEQNELLGELVEKIFELTPETRAMIFKKFCVDCGEINKKCTCFDYE